MDVEELIEKSFVNLKKILSAEDPENPEDIRLVFAKTNEAVNGDDTSTESEPVEGEVKENKTTIVENQKRGKDDFDGDRKSEQELKQIFIENLIKDKNFYYSVETPTRHLYKFGDEKKNAPLVLNNKVNKEERIGKVPGLEKKVKELEEEKGKNDREYLVEKEKLENIKAKYDGFTPARVDVSVYKKIENEGKKENKLQNHVEFKYGTPDKFCITKDFLKLVCDPVDPENWDKNKKSYFVHYYEGEDESFVCIINKMKDAVKYLREYGNEKNEDKDKFDVVKSKIGDLFDRKNYIEDYLDVVKDEQKQKQNNADLENRLENVIVYFLMKYKANNEFDYYVMSLKDISDLSDKLKTDDEYNKTFKDDFKGKKGETRKNCIEKNLRSLEDCEIKIITNNGIEDKKE